MKRLLPFLFSVILIPAFAQQTRHDQLIQVVRSAQSSTIKSLEAQFKADITQGTAPLTVQFTDESTGNPTSWKWTFGDGDSSLVQNPMHVYQSAGLYTVKLTISDGTNGFALEKNDYISVNPDFVNCDTLRYPLPEPLTYYIITDKGYVTGNNSYGDKAIAEYFENSQPNLVITGLICELSKAKQAAGHNEVLPVKIWKTDGTSGSPGQVLSVDTLMLSTVVNDVTNNRITNLDFNNPAQPGSSFFMGVMLPVITGDTICFWSTSSGKLTTNTTWIQENTDVWESAFALWTPQGGPDFIISCAIYPKICLLNGIEDTEIPLPFAVWPNPAHDIITVVNQQNSHENAQYSIFDVSGKQLLKGNIAGSITTTIDVRMLKPGIYILHINGKKSVFSTRLVIK